MGLLEKYFQNYQSCAQSALEYWLPSPNDSPQLLHSAMRYTVLGSGKRIRPILVYATGATFGISTTLLRAPACAVEIIHAYSLIHDDLPAMDNDDLRRGRPTCHIKFDEATAILAGDSLQALAFCVLACDQTMQVSAQQKIRMINILANASGSKGMAGGQAMDLAAVGKKLDISELEDMHRRKTGALICASVQLGALSIPQIDETLFEKISHYARCIGLAFQVQDDILDIEGDTVILGKPQGSDIARNKPTYPEILGVENAKKVLYDLYEEAMDYLSTFKQNAEPLRQITSYIVKRDR